MKSPNASRHARRLILLALAVSLPFAGCAKPADAKAYIKMVKPGMTEAEVEAALGKGDDVAPEALPPVARQIVAQGGKDGHFRKWVKKDGATTTTIYAGFRDGKVGTPYFEQTGSVETKDGKARF
jgi:hypothetical protein